MKRSLIRGPDALRMRRRRGLRTFFLTPALVVLATAAAFGQSTGSSEPEPELNPLAPVDTSSPRTTLSGFLSNVQEGYRPFYDYQEATAVSELAQGRAERTLDTSELPPALADRLVGEAAVLLKEILDRVPLPAEGEIPDAESMRALEDGVPRYWRIPDTAIEIALIEEGPRAGEYLFTAETVSRLREFYGRARTLPYKPDAMPGLYERLVHEPGPLISHRLIFSLPSWARQSLGDQAMWQWTGLCLALGLWFAALIVAHRVSRPRADGRRRYWLRVVCIAAMILLTAGVRDFVDRQLTIVGTAFKIVDTSLIVASVVFATLAIINIGSAIGETIVTSPKIDPKSIDAHLIRVATRTVALLGVVIIFVLAAGDLGIPLTAVITSLGVGGFAFALAVRPTLENFFAGITLFLDKPVRVGEFCQFGDVLGTVEEIGLRSTRIRRWGGNLITVPNAQFAEFQLDNYDDARHIWIRTQIDLRYETTADQLRYVLANLREMLMSHPKLSGEPRVRLVGFGDFSLKVEILAYTDTGNWSEWQGIREDVYLRVMEIVEAAGTAFAFPSNTTYFARDPGLDEEKKGAAEAQVEAWRDSGELPFPNMALKRRKEIRGTLDFPPAGSVENKPKFPTSE
jgi:MscS family membrane protein